MNYILFNADGSVNKTNFTEVINQNNEGDKIFVSVDGLDISSHTCVGIFVLPDKSASVEGGEEKSDYEYAPNKTANGYLITLSQSETALAGIVYLTIQIKESGSRNVLYSYRVPLTINETTALATYVNITLAQYNNLLDYINSLTLDSYVPYTGATNNLDLGNHSLIANDVFASSNVNIGVDDTYISIQDSYIICLKDGGETDFLFPDTGEVETLAVQSQLPKKGVCANFNTGSFELQAGGNYAVSDIPVSNFIAGSDMLVITWDNCFALCPIPQSGAGRVVAALWSADSESKIVRVRYELKDSNTKLDISLSGGFTPPSNHTAYVFCYKLVN